MFHVSCETAALNHEVIDDPVKNRAVVEAIRDIRQEILHRLRSIVCVELQGHGADSGGHQDMRSWHEYLRGLHREAASYLRWRVVAMPNFCGKWECSHAKLDAQLV